MMTDALHQYELEEIAGVAQVPTARIEYLGKLDPDDLHVLRKAVAAKLHRQYSADYRLLGKLVRFVPKRMAARLGVTYLPPRILGRAAAPVFDGRGGRLLIKMNRVPPEIIADAAPFMDPRTIGSIAAVIPTGSRQLVNGVMDELIRRDELATLDRMMLYMGEGPELFGSQEF